MMKWLGSAALLALPLFSTFGQDTAPPEDPPWQIATLKESFEVANSNVLRFRHLRGDVRITAADTERVQVTALAQYHPDDPRRPAIQFRRYAADCVAFTQVLTIDFTHLEVAEDEAWAKRRIDVGLLVPRGIEVEIETQDGLIEAKDLSARAKLTSSGGEILYKGTGSLEAHSDHGEVGVIMKQTAPEHTLALSSLTSDIRCTLLEGARARIDVETRGPITTDYSIEIHRETGSLLKTGRIELGEGGSSIQLKSHSGGIRLQGLIAAEKNDH